MNTNVQEVTKNHWITRSLSLPMDVFWFRKCVTYSWRYNRKRRQHMRRIVMYKWKFLWDGWSSFEYNYKSHEGHSVATLYLYVLYEQPNSQLWASHFAPLLCITEVFSNKACAASSLLLYLLSPPWTYSHII